jgi:hypothetical protein
VILSRIARTTDYPTIPTVRYHIGITRNQSPRNQRQESAAILGCLASFWHVPERSRNVEPEIKYFNTACVTDNSVEAVLLPDAAE